MLHRKRIKTKFRDFFPSDDRDKTNETLNINVDGNIAYN